MKRCDWCDKEVEDDALKQLVTGDEVCEECMEDADDDDKEEE